MHWPFVLMSLSSRLLARSTPQARSMGSASNTGIVNYDYEQTSRAVRACEIRKKKPIKF
jgi:hypothetical protein